MYTKLIKNVLLFKYFLNTVFVFRKFYFFFFKHVYSFLVFILPRYIQWLKISPFYSTVSPLWFACRQSELCDPMEMSLQFNRNWSTSCKTASYLWVGASKQPCFQQIFMNPLVIKSCKFSLILFFLIIIRQPCAICLDGKINKVFAIEFIVVNLW